MTAEPQVRDFTGNRRPQPRAQVAMHGAADLLLTLWILGDSCVEPDPQTPWKSYDLGADWFVDLGVSFRLPR